MTVKVAVVGTGSIGLRHLRVLRQLPAVEPVAIPKRLERVEELQKQGFSTAKDLDQAIGQGAGLCLVASDTGQHLRDGLLALARGLDTMVEKPLARDCAEAQCLNSQARSTGQNLFVACVLRFSESLNTFRDMLTQAGLIHSVRIEAQSYLPDWRPNRDYRDSYSARADEGGVLRDMIHEVDYAGWLFGWPASLQARLENLGRLGIDSEESADLNWQTPDGASVSLRLDFVSKPAHRGITARGDRGAIEWDGIAKTVTLALGNEAKQMIPSSQDIDDMYLAQARAFVNAASGDLDPRLATGGDGVRAMAVCDAARRASDTKHEEWVAYP